jgi:hypothetical protein
MYSNLGYIIIGIFVAFMSTLIYKESNNNVNQINQINQINMHNPTIVYKKSHSDEIFKVVYSSTIIPTSGKVIIDKEKYFVSDIEYNYDDNKVIITLY